MKTSIRELRGSLKHILYAVQHGEEVVIYSHSQPIATIVPIEKTQEIKEDFGFGMWRDDETKSDVDTYVRNMRKGRKHDL